MYGNECANKGNVEFCFRYYCSSLFCVGYLLYFFSILGVVIDETKERALTREHK